MKYFLCTTLLLFFCFVSKAQSRVIFKLNNVPISHASDSFFIAGSFNGWNPHDTQFSLSKQQETVVQIPAGSYEFKITRGTWHKVEGKPAGADVENRQLKISSDTTIALNIEAWKDDFAEAPKMHTASKQVRVMDSLFFIPQLNRSRRIWIYLPEGYETSKKQYPVLYMHDGQNLFDSYTAGFGEWGVDECLDSLIKMGKPACIVIGIDNGPKRLNEYNPYAFRDFGEGEGSQYLDFISQTLKPFIDKNYRTLSSKENTIIAGSSMGGLISYYAMIKLPQVFGKAGIFSPAFWTAPAIKSLTDSVAAKISGKFFFYIGEQEGESFVNDMKQVQECLGERSNAQIYSLIDEEGTHNENAWRKWFPDFYCWIMAEGFNDVIKFNR